MEEDPAGMVIALEAMPTTSNACCVALKQLLVGACSCTVCFFVPNFFF